MSKLNIPRHYDIFHAKESETISDETLIQINRMINQLESAREIIKHYANYEQQWSKIKDQSYSTMSGIATRWLEENKE